MAKRIYIAGPMSGVELYNFPAFFDAALRLLEEGFDPINPAEKESFNNGFPNLEAIPEDWGGLSETVSPGDIIKRDFHEVLEVDCLALLPDWQHSTGAMVEALMAVQAQIPVFLYAPFGPIVLVRLEPSDVFSAAAELFMYKQTVSQGGMN